MCLLKKWGFLSYLYDWGFEVADFKKVGFLKQSFIAKVSNLFSLYSYVTGIITLEFVIPKWCSLSIFAAATKKIIFQNTFQCLLSLCHIIMYWECCGRKVLLHPLLLKGGVFLKKLLYGLPLLQTLSFEWGP